MDRLQAMNAPCSRTFSNCPTRTSRVICWPEMSHPILAARRSAVSSCNRIELIPSLFAAGAWFAWLALACAVTWFAVALPAGLRFTLCAAVALAGARAISGFVLLRGPRAVKAIEWNEAGEWFVCLGATATPLPATLSRGSFRLGLRYWVLRFATPVGPRSVLVAEPARTRSDFRRLSRSLNGHLRRGSGHSGPPAVTSRPKV